MNLLVLDDNQDSLGVLAQLLGHRLGAQVATTQFPTKALQLAREKFYDMVLVDVTLDYRGSPFGGLDIYEELLPRYGAQSIIAYSEVVTDSMLRKYPFVDNFINRHKGPVEFAEELATTVGRLRDQQTCFVAMPFSKDSDPLYAVLESAIKTAAYVPIRVDQQHFTRSILEQILLEIRKAKLVVFVATDKNPNAFYECGFSVALDKEVVTVTNSLEDLPFDIRDRNAIRYSATFDGLAVSLAERLLGLTCAP